MKDQSKFDQYIGQTFGKLTVESWYFEGYSRMALCLCECGRRHGVRLSNLTNGSTVQCPECRKTRRVKPGDRFGKLVAVEETGEHDKHRKMIWLCKCDCGNKKLVPITNLLAKGPSRTQSCGCGQFVKPPLQGTVAALAFASPYWCEAIVPCRVVVNHHSCRFAKCTQEMKETTRNPSGF